MAVIICKGGLSSLNLFKVFTEVRDYRPAITVIVSHSYKYIT